MRKLLVPALAALVLVASPLAARAVKTVTPLPNEVIGAAQITQVDVKVSDSAKKVFDALEDKAAHKKGFVSASGGTPPSASEQAEAAYAAMPFAEMFPHVVHDEMVKRKLTSGRELKLSLQLDTLKTADAGMAMLLGSQDQLAGVVTLSDAATGAVLGEYYIDVINFRSGLMGLAMRGSGVREKLAAEFAKHVAEVMGKKASTTA